MTNIYAALEIGTSRTVLAIGEAKTGERLRVICHAEIPSSGVHKSQIRDIGQATRSISSVLRETGRKLKESGDTLDICNAFLVISGPHVKVDPYQGTAQVEGSKVGNNDIAEVIQSSRLLSLPRDRDLLDIVDQSYELDTLGGITSPKGMSGRVLKLNTLHIHADKNQIDNARTAASGARLEIRDPLFATTCAAEAVLSPAEKNNGVLVLDLGGGSTGWAAYSRGSLVAASVIGVGGEHITNDIAFAFQTTQAQAEGLKRSDASALVGSDHNASARVKMHGSTPLMEARTVSRRALDTVVNLRCKELFSIVRNELEDRDLLHILSSGVVITGGGAALKDVDKLLQRELGMQVRIGQPTEIDGLNDVPNPASFAAIAGALLYAHHNYEEKPFFRTLLERWFK